MLWPQVTEQRNTPAASKGKQGLWRSKAKDAPGGGAVPTVEVLDKDGNRQGTTTLLFMHPSYWDLQAQPAPAVFSPASCRQNMD